MCAAFCSCLSAWVGSTGKFFVVIMRWAACVCIVSDVCFVWSVWVYDTRGFSTRDGSDGRGGVIGVVPVVSEIGSYILQLFSSIGLFFIVVVRSTVVRE